MDRLRCTRTCTRFSDGCFAPDSLASIREAVGAAMEPANWPLSFGSAAGRHRAGWVASVLLLVLGVRPEHIAREFVDAGGGSAEYLQAALGAARMRHGSTDGYIRDAIGVSDEHRAAFQHLCLE